MPLTEFFVTTYLTVIAQHEVLTEIRIPVPAQRSGPAFREVAKRIGDFAIVKVAPLVSKDARMEVSSVSIAPGGVAEPPVSIDGSQAVLGRSLGAERAAEAARLIDQAIDPQDDNLVGAAYKRHFGGLPHEAGAARRLCRRHSEGQMTTNEVAMYVNSVTVILNGTSYTRAVEPRLLLSDFLRNELTLIGTHVGCEHGTCGACTVLVGGRAVRACLIFAAQAEGIDVETKEGLDAGPHGPHPIQRAFIDRHDVAAMVDMLWDRVELIECDTGLISGTECILYPNSHTPGSQCVYIKTLDGIEGCVGATVRRVDMNSRKAIPPGIFYDLEQMQRAMRDIAIRGDIVYPAHDPLVLEGDEEKRRAALSPGKLWP